MARWTETRGITLRLRQAQGSDQLAHVGLVRKRTLLGAAFNVREARAEELEQPGDPEAVGGRLDGIPAVIANAKKRIGRPSASVTACSLVFMPPFVRPIRRPLWSPDPPFSTAGWSPCGAP